MDCRRMGTPSPNRPRTPRLLATRRQWMGAPPLRPLGAAPFKRAGGARLLVRGGRLRAVGPPTAALRGRVGKGGALEPRGDRQELAVGRESGRSGARKPLA